MATTGNKRKSNPGLPKTLYAEASVRSLGGTSLFETSEMVSHETIDRFDSDPGMVESAVSNLRKEGFEVINQGQTTLTISG